MSSNQENKKCKTIHVSKKLDQIEIKSLFLKRLILLLDRRQ